MSENRRGDFLTHRPTVDIDIIIIISLFIQQQNSTNTVTNVDTNDVNWNGNDKADSTYSHPSVLKT